MGDEKGKLQTGQAIPETDVVRSEFSGVARNDAAALPRKPGRPTTFTPEKGRLLVAIVRELGFLSTSARRARVSPQTVEGWLEKGLTGEEPFHAFLLDFKAAQAEWEAERLQRVEDPRWLLERQNPTVYGKPSEGSSQTFNIGMSQTVVSSPERQTAAGRKVLEMLGRDPKYLSHLDEDSEDDDAG